jgi:DNA-binding PucR family transcriptional regulator
VARSRRRPGTSAAVTDRPAGGRGQVERVEKLLAGEILDTSRLAYDFDVDHVALIASGPGATRAIDDRVAATGLSSLSVEADEGMVWGWLGSRDGFDVAAFEAVTPSARAGDLAGPGKDLRLAIGEPSHGLGGWRLSHHQARAALAVAHRGTEPVVRYGDVALLASLVRDELLGDSLRRLYIEPLEGDRDGGEELRRTLRAYFEADRNVSEAGSAIGVTRQAVARRLRAAEERIGRPLGTCGAELELALRFEALAPTPLSAP